MQKPVQLKKFDFSGIKGLSKEQLTQHYQLYKGYVDTANKIWSGKKKNDIRCIELAQGYSVDGVKLHVLYFENLGDSCQKPYGSILNLIEKDFGSYADFEKLFKEIGAVMRGWVVLAFDPLDERLHIYGQDTHDKGSIWDAVPLLVMDVYEHAYMIDFGIDKKRYINVFFNNINWEVVNDRLIKNVYGEKCYALNQTEKKSEKRLRLTKSKKGLKFWKK